MPVQLKNRFDAVLSNLAVSIENQAGVAMLSQANSAPNRVLSMLR